ncbi:MAG TPA: hypothetical protein VIK06_05535 [Candidatus Limnocylindrales bacterium]|jgi:hemerythrin
MRRYECRAAQLNARQHADFVRIVTRFRADHEAEGATTKLVLRVQDQLAWWLDTHIRAIDTQLYPCVLARPGLAGAQPPRVT